MTETDLEVGKLLCMIQNSVHRRLTNSIIQKEVEGMTGKNGWIIGFLASRSGEPVYQRDLEKEFNVTRSTASKVISLMEKKGFVQRRGVESDARLKEIMLTEKGRTLALRMKQDIDDIEVQLTRGFSPEEYRQLMDYLTRIFENLNGCKGGEKL